MIKFIFVQLNSILVTNLSLICIYFHYFITEFRIGYLFNELSNSIIKKSNNFFKKLLIRFPETLQKKRNLFLRFIEVKFLLTYVKIQRIYWNDLFIMVNNFPTISYKAFRRNAFRGRHNARLKRKVHHRANRWRRWYDSQRIRFR